MPIQAPAKVLVTGANGFIAAHVVEQLLARGFEVVGTVRDPHDPAKVGHLQKLPHAAEHLTLAAADLSRSDAFDALTDVDALMHMASPYVLDVRDPQRDLVDPAVNGTLSLLRAAAGNPRVRRVVLTSSMAAVTDAPDGRVLTEADWNASSSLERNPYYFSKTMAERAAWDFMRDERPGFDLVVINPFLVIGPAHTAAVNTSNQTLADIVNGKYPAVLALTWGFVDVRDIAAAHVAAMTTPAAAGRYLAAAGTMSMAEVVDVMRAKGWGHAKLPKIGLANGFGTALMKLASHTQPRGVGSYLRTHLGRVPRFDTSRIRDELGIEFRTPEQSVEAALADLAQWGHIPKPRR